MASGTIGSWGRPGLGDFSLGEGVRENRGYMRVR